jgi:hypothetical protein
MRPVSFFVLFNEEVTKLFKPVMEINEGDPISPYLFLLAAEGLSCLLRSKGNGNLSSILVAPLAPPVNHVLIADDNLLFVKANSVGTIGISEVLETYYLSSFGSTN